MGGGGVDLESFHPPQLQLESRRVRRTGTLDPDAVHVWNKRPSLPAALVPADHQKGQ